MFRLLKHITHGGTNMSVSFLILGVYYIQMGLNTDKNWLTSKTVRFNIFDGCIGFYDYNSTGMA